MLYAIYKNNNPYVSYRGGQEPIVHIEADLLETVGWAERAGRRWAISLQNASADYFEDRCTLDALSDLNWEAIQTHYWSQTETKEAKQAEFLIELSFPIELISNLGVCTPYIHSKLRTSIEKLNLSIPVELEREWYY